MENIVFLVDRIIEKLEQEIKNEPETFDPYEQGFSDGEINGAYYVRNEISNLMHQKARREEENELGGIDD
ncbi:hypothetical protein KQI68_07115 [Peptoniphilus sp. MSJ-1]|uniref:Phage protein n=1 Tax=Peptoniphilus ovalis TaxID=2841503 RepID=A0ABS6FHG1_9FIRM|nr:hypothetical protein [Peptoniphilus ovalis]MBU5669608.1 hypothetical protein [Peptoniphilus ovalis]